MTIAGLRGVYGALLRHEEEHGRDVSTSEDAANHLGWWWQHLRFRQAVARQMDTYGIALGVPVIAGEHSCGPWLVTVHRATEVVHHAEASERILAERTAAAHQCDQGIDGRDRGGAGRPASRAAAAAWGWRHRDKTPHVRRVRRRPARPGLCRSPSSPHRARSLSKTSDREFDSIVTGYVAYRRG